MGPVIHRCIALLWLSSFAAWAHPAILIPESERGLKACVMGLDPADGEYFGLPKFDAALARAHGWDRQLYWLDHELSHGCLMRLMPEEAKIYVACPDSPLAGHTVEERFFKSYLKTRAGWSDARIRSQLRFFRVHDPLIWAQDFALELGQDSRGQCMLHLGPEDAPVYRQFADHLIAEHPDAFSKKVLPSGVSGEGGDLALARWPDGKVGLIIGRHRVLHYFEVKGRTVPNGQAVSPEAIAEVEQAYSKAYGVPVLVCPKRPLLEGWGSDELFHLDMVASFLSDPATAVVPRLVEGAIDHSSGQALDPAFANGLSREFDVVADELGAAGFRVQRAPLDDHPVRSPTNSIKYLSSKAGKKVVLLARYAREGDALPALHRALDHLNAVAADVYSKPSRSQIAAVDEALAGVWAAMNTCNLEPDPSYEGQAQAYRTAGFMVVPVPDYPWGAGSLHCQFLH